MPFDVTDFKALMTLESEGPDVFVGIGPSYPWGRVYGGQVVAQALRAAYSTICLAGASELATSRGTNGGTHGDAESGTGHRVHSLHAYFIRGGDSDEPIRFEVDRIRDGRSFQTRRVVARQSVGPILNLSASFQLEEDQADVQECALDGGLAQPEELEPTDWGPILERRHVECEGVRTLCWLRVAGDLGEDRILQDCALAYASDDIPTEAAGQSHPKHTGPPDGSGAYDEIFVGASLDHAIWFHRPGRHDDWVMHDFRGYGVVGARGFSIGQLYSRAGVHLATVTQEILMRERTR